MLNSRLGLFTAAPSGFNTLPERPFSRSYGAILPSSLTRVIPRTLGFSPRLPVSVCGTGTGFLARRFSWQCEIRDFATIFRSASQLGLNKNRICLSPPPTGLDAYSQNALELPHRVMPLLPPGIGSGTRLTCASHPPFSYPQATPCGANDR